MTESNKPTAALDEATITQFWKLLSRVDDAGIVEMLFAPAAEDTQKKKASEKKKMTAANKNNKKKANDADDTESDEDGSDSNDEFFGETAMEPKPHARDLVNTAKDGTFPLLYAVQNSFDARTVVALIAAGADTNQQRLKGDKHTPLIAACWGEDDVLAGCLLKHGAKITATDGNGMNAFHVCATLGAHNFLGHLLANYVDSSSELVTLMSAAEATNGMTPLQIVIQELPMSLQQNDRRYMLCLEEMFQGMGVKMTDTFPQALAANTRSPKDVSVVFSGDDRAAATAAAKKKDDGSAAEEEPTTGGRKRLKTEKNPAIFPTRGQMRKIFEVKDASGSNIAHTVAEILGTIPPAQPLLRTIFTTFAFATFDPAVPGSKLFTQQDADGNTPLHIMLQHAYLTANPQAASVATAMVVTTITPAIRAAAACKGLPGNNLVLEQVRNLVAATPNNEGLSCLGLCAAIAEVPAAASLSAEMLALWVSVLPNPQDRRGLFGANAEAYRAFLLGWAISKQNAATQMKATNPEMAANILNPDAERRINLDMNHCIAKIVGIPNILGTAETLSIFGGLPREAALNLRNEAIGRAATLAETAAKAAAAEEEEEKAKAEASGGCCGGASSCGSKKGDFSGLGSKGEKTEAKETTVDEKGPAEKASAADIAAVTPGKGLKWAAYGLMCMMLMGVMLPVIEFVFPATKASKPTKGKKGGRNQKKKNTFREDEETSRPSTEEEL